MMNLPRQRGRRRSLVRSLDPHRRTLACGDPSALNAVARLPKLGRRAAEIRRQMETHLVEHRRHVRREGEDLPLLRDWQWEGK